MIYLYISYSQNYLCTIKYLDTELKYHFQIQSDLKDIKLCIYNFCFMCSSKYTSLHTYK